MASSLPPEVKRADTTAGTTSAVLQSVRFLQRSANLFTQSHCRADFLLRCHEVTTRESGAGMTNKFLLDAEHWRTRAEKARLLAKETKASETKNALPRDR
jgi:hypothetical protein